MRVVFATQRYWPAVSPAIATLDQIAGGLAQLESDDRIQVTVLTGQWEAQWPTELIVRDVPVIRFPIHSWNLLSRSNLGSHIADWLIAHHQSWDVLVIYGTIEGGDRIFQAAAQTNKPVFIHVSEYGPSTLFENHDLLVKHRKRLSPWLQHPHWITSDEASASAIGEHNPEAEIRLWNLGISNDPILNKAERKDLRLAITATHPALRGSRFLPLVVFDGPYDDDDEAIWLWRLLQQLFSQRSDFRVWLTGDGPTLPRLFHSILADELEEYIALPGCFHNKADLYATADLVIFPHTQSFPKQNFLIAQSVQTPTLVSRSMANRIPLDSLTDEEALPDDRLRWVTAILDHIDDSRSLEQQASIWREDLIQNLPLSATLKSYLQILKSLENS